MSLISVQVTFHSELHSVSTVSLGQHWVFVPHDPPPLVTQQPFGSHYSMKAGKTWRVLGTSIPSALLLAATMESAILLIISSISD